MLVAHYAEQDPASFHHILPMIATLFGTLGMYWILGRVWLREVVKRLFTVAKDLFARLR